MFVHAAFHLQFPFGGEPVKQGLVLKMGGSLGGDSLQAVASTIRMALAQERSVVLVHGGGPRISRALATQGIELPFVEGQRLTTDEAVHVVQRVLAEINLEVVTLLQSVGIPALGVATDNGLLEASPIPGLKRTARVNYVNADPIREWTEAGQVPVFAPIGMKKGLIYNMNADLAAAAIGGALGANRVVFLTDVAGIYENWETKKLLTNPSPQHLLQLYHAGSFQAGMIPKVEAVLACLDAGVPNAFVVDGRSEKAVAWASLATEDELGAQETPLGTRVTREGVFA
ncbi:MAG: acetylglutamate kinase [Alicyclobacillus sp. RIFOXYA1_FULL_53_8]|nr:MAG: acetylglutamate kinase [Alicyclobacillus sp. RIFOXYA1_FULL_53_8]